VCGCKRMRGAVESKHCMDKTKKELQPLLWHNERRRIDELVPYGNNPRRLTSKQRADLKASISRFHLVEVPAINTDNTIVSGHMRLKILSGIEGRDYEVDVRVPNRTLTEQEFKEYNIRANKNTGEFDFDILSNNFEYDDLQDWGFSDDELTDFTLDLIDDDDSGDDVVPDKPVEARSQLGDLYELGSHRVLCGDSTDKEIVAALMNGDKADMVFTDPPYNVNYGISKNHPSWKIRTIANDSMSPSEWEAFCNKVFVQLKEYCVGDIYVWGASGPDGMRARLWLADMGCHWSATIIWKKDRLVLSPAKYQRMYEPCFYGWFKKSSFVADRKQTEVWEFNKPHKSDLHPTMKPVELCGYGIGNSSNVDSIVLDLFLGSGSTLIACEKTKRRCYGMELDPQYVDVIVQRYVDYTGNNNIRLNGEDIEWGDGGEVTR